MHMLITGSTGFIGSAFVNSLINNKNFNLIIMSRQNLKIKSIRLISSNREINLKEKVDVIINLAGATINKRGRNSYKREWINSRLKITKDIISLINRLKTKPSLPISASAIGYYESQNNSHINASILFVCWRFCSQVM